MNYEVRISKSFDKQLKNLRRDFSLTLDEFNEALDNLFTAIALLEETGKLPKIFEDHTLLDPPWTGFQEFHILENLLAVYFRVDSKHKIRLVSIESHKSLRQGKQPK